MTIRDITRLIVLLTREAAAIPIQIPAFLTPE